MSKTRTFRPKLLRLLGKAMQIISEVLERDSTKSSASNTTPTVQQEPKYCTERGTVASLNEDILIAIAQLVAVKDILSLRLTCKWLRKVTMHPAIWRSAIKNLSNFMPIPLPPPKTLGTTPSSELEALAKAAVQMDISWRKGEPYQPSIRRCMPDRLIFLSAIVPGGRWLLGVHKNLSIVLWDLDEASPKDIHVSDGIDLTVPLIISMCSFLAEGGDYIILTQGCARADTVPMTYYELYSLRPEDPVGTFSQLGSFSLPRQSKCIPSLQNEHVALGFWDSTPDFEAETVHVFDWRVFITTPRQPFNQAQLRLGSSVESFLLISHERLLSASEGKIAIYHIGEMVKERHLISLQSHSEAIEIWSHHFGSTEYRPIIPPRSSLDRSLGGSRETTLVYVLGLSTLFRLTVFEGKYKLRCVAHNHRPSSHAHMGLYWGVEAQVTTRPASQVTFTTRSMFSPGQYRTAGEHGLEEIKLRMGGRCTLDLAPFQLSPAAIFRPILFDENSSRVCVFFFHGSRPSSFITLKFAWT